MDSVQMSSNRAQSLPAPGGAPRNWASHTGSFFASHKSLRRGDHSCPQHIAEGTEAQRGVTPGSDRATGSEARSSPPTSLQEALLDGSSPAPTLYPVDTKTETGFMVPGTTHLLPHHRNWPPALGQRPAGGAWGSDRAGHTAGMASWTSSSVTRGYSLRDPGWQSPNPWTHLDTGPSL